MSDLPSEIWVWPSDTGMKCSPEMHTGIAVRYIRADKADELADAIDYALGNSVITADQENLLKGHPYDRLEEALAKYRGEK